MAAVGFDSNLTGSIGQQTCAPQTNSVNMGEIPHCRSIFSDVNQRRDLSSSSGEQARDEYPFYSNVEHSVVAPQGFPSMAAEQTRWPNTGTFRRFDNLNWRRLKFYETKLSYLEDQLHRLDVAEAMTIHGLQRSRLPFNKRIFSDCCFRGSDASCVPDPVAGNDQDEFAYLRENLYAHVEHISTKYHELVSNIQRLSTLPRVSHEEHMGLFTAARERHGLGNEAIDHHRAIDDMAYVSVNTVESQIQSLWLATGPRIKNLLLYLGVTKSLPDSDGSQIYSTVDVDGFRIVLKVLITLSTTLLSSSLILAPVGILFLGGLSKPLSFVVVVIFGVVFAVALILIEQHRIGHAVVGAVAYIAVLATFLANVA